MDYFECPHRFLFCCRLRATGYVNQQLANIPVHCLPALVQWLLSRITLNIRVIRIWKKKTCAFIRPSLESNFNIVHLRLALWKFQLGFLHLQSNHYFCFTLRVGARCSLVHSFIVVAAARVRLCNTSSLTSIPSVALLLFTKHKIKMFRVYQALLNLVNSN